MFITLCKMDDDVFLITWLAKYSDILLIMTHQSYWRLKSIKFIILFKY